jgi:SAM domain (Sterile alpha motif)
VDVAGWLLGLGRYEQAFRENNIDLEILPRLTAEDLIAIGVTSVGHSRKLLDAITTLSVDPGFPIYSEGSLGPRTVLARLQEITSMTPGADVYNGPGQLPATGRLRRRTDGSLQMGRRCCCGIGGLVITCTTNAQQARLATAADIVAARQAGRRNA